MKALVTGGAGFIGSHLADRLLQEGYSVRILDSLHPRVHPKGKPLWLPGDAEFIQGDVRDRDTLAKALQGVQIVFHQAAYQDYMLDFSTFMHVNAVSTALIHELILQSGKEHGAGRTVEKVIVASSQAVYGEGQYECRNGKCQQHQAGVIHPSARSHEQLHQRVWDVLCPECRQPMRNLRLRESYQNPHNAYAISKLAEELTAVRLGKLHGIPSVALRYSIVQGPRQSLYNQYSGICRIFCTRLLNGLPPVIYEDGLQLRDYTHIDDVVEANMTVLKDDRADYEVFNVGSGCEVTVHDYADGLIRRLDSSIEPLFPGEYRVGDNRHSVSDVEKLKKLGWAPQHGLADILNDYVSWVEAQGDLGDYFRHAEGAMREQGVVRKAGDS
jgi:dTDP-L-rhamnose 4-epimerase